ncbi:MAG: efflux RND transporter periplasmic adaptor subunit [Treponema sp.]|jgi:multidrug efflux pump subunit AcrA (membrane-fusion protein)|nr:efflux RND transporter periplasmic adaptor subunit [Treponema sp.]
MEKMEKTMKSKAVKKAALFIAALAGIAVLAAGPAATVRDKAPAEVPAESVLVKAARAERRTLRAFLEVNGDIVSGQEAGIFPQVSGKLVQVSAALGSRVQKGDLVASVDPSRPGDVYMTSPVYAPISGVISRMPLSTGMIVDPSTSISTVSAIDWPEITARIPEREIAGLEPGLTAEVGLEAYPGETFTAVVTRVSPVLDSASRTKLITLGFEVNDGRINAGMFARVKISMRVYEDVLAVPSEALVTGRDLYVVKNGAAEKRKAETGVSLDGWTEIKSGIDEWDAVVVQGQQLLSGGEAVQVINK